MNTLILGMKDLIQRSITEAIDLRIEPSDVPCTTRCDPHQLENALLNLAINARDAMPSGGRLTITTALLDSVAPRAGGRSVRVSVTDTGTGMPPAVVARAFDPFFTTKPIGKGTGLGLSMIYGFARQSGGDASIQSRIDEGTTIHIRLPFAQGEITEDERPAVASSATSRGETIVVVEDEVHVRTLVVNVLEEAGYHVRSAADGPTGLAMLASGPVDLVVSDVGLPGLNGRQMADAARVDSPRLKILFMTGYAESAASTEGFLEAGMAMIAKPFQMDAFLTKVRSLLDAGPG